MQSRKEKTVRQNLRMKARIKMLEIRRTRTRRRTEKNKKKKSLQQEE